MSTPEQVLADIDAVIVDPILYTGTPIDEAEVDCDLWVPEGLDQFPIPPTPAGATSLEDVFGPVIDTYTRADAIADGSLVPVPRAVSTEAGIRVPVAMTRAAWEDCVAWDEDDNRRKGTVQDEAGRLWDVMWMAGVAIRRSRLCDRDRANVCLYRVPRPGRTVVARVARLIAVTGPGDHGEPVMTILMAGES